MAQWSIWSLRPFCWIWKIIWQRRLNALLPDERLIRRMEILFGADSNVVPALDVYPEMGRQVRVLILDEYDAFLS